ncbi:hypothetical protein IDM40_21920 [Nocardiopsis sp. HNM0947]|uniref:Uncharacterized protein n=1 Tax=Nocardiopsis coralli TaxID=2772213 RepID=A0ABR9PBY3_9ACTN|nr:hypothetical protein [Nocardiopsis coralli]MBE3001329.1 hypothetical protein [Nocardiopsis coralli]
MSQTHREDRNRGPLGTKLLAGACCVGALAYAVLVGPSMLPPQDVEATNTAGSEETEEPVEEPEAEPELEGPVGHLEVQVSELDRAWVQTLTCTGDLDRDHAACTALAEAAVDFEGDTDSTVEVPELQEEELEEQEPAEDAPVEAGVDAGPPEEEAGQEPGTEVLFTEVREGTVCTDTVYGPQEAAITGVWEGEDIDTTLSRQGSCEEARWQRLRSLTEELA